MPNHKNVANDWPLEEPLPLTKLRDLLAVLHVSEKNMFKRYIRSYGANNHEANYIKLFDCVNDCLLEGERESKKGGSTAKPGQTFYQKFIARHHLRKLGQPKELGPMAIYLYDRILSALRYQNTEKNPRLDLEAQLLDIQFLIRKGLQQEAMIMIQTAKEAATRLEALPHLILLAQLEFRLVFNSKNQVVDKFNSLYVSELKWLKQLETITHLKDLRGALLLVLWGQGNVEDNPELRAKLNFFIQYVNENRPRQTFEEKLNFHSIMAWLISINQQKPSEFLHQFLSEHPPEALTNHYKALVNLYDDYPERKKEDYRRYNDNVFNYLVVALANKVEVNLDNYSQLLDSIPASDQDFLRNVVYIRLVNFVMRKEFAAAKEYLQTNKVWELSKNPKNEVFTSRLQTIRYQAGMVCFVRGDLQEASKWFSANLQPTNQPNNAEAQGASALYDLLVRFELGFSSQVINRKLLQPLYDYLPHDEPFIQNIIKTMARLLEAGKDKEAISKIAGEMLPVLEMERKHRTAINHFGLFFGWLESKRRKLPFRAVIEPYI